MNWDRTVLWITIAGLLSRIVHSGSILIDKYLGDALYAALSYALLRRFGLSHRPALFASLASMTALELFQRTGIPLKMAYSMSLPIRMLSKLLGTEFSYADLAAYGAGIAAIAWAAERRRT